MICMTIPQSMMEPIYKGSNNSGLWLSDGENRHEDDNNVVESVVRWKTELDPDVLEELIEEKVANVKDPLSNFVTVEKLESGESSFMKLEHSVVSFHHGVEKE